MTNLITNVEKLCYGHLTKYETTIGLFNVYRRDTCDYYGNPIYIIEPLGYIESLPPVKFAKRNNKEYYTIKTYNIEEDFKHFLDRLNESIKKGNKLYVNPCKI